MRSKNQVDHEKSDIQHEMKNEPQVGYEGPNIWCKRSEAQDHRGLDTWYEMSKVLVNHE